MTPSARLRLSIQFICRIWRGAETGQTLDGFRNPLWTVTIQVRRQRQSLLSRNTMTWRAVTGGRKHRTLTRLLKVFHEGPGPLLSRGQKNMCRHLWKTPRFLENLLEDENLFCSATAGTKTASDILQLSSIISQRIFSRHLAYTFPGG